MAYVYDKIGVGGRDVGRILVQDYLSLCFFIFNKATIHLKYESASQGSVTFLTGKYA